MEKFINKQIKGDGDYLKTIINEQKEFKKIYEPLVEILNNYGVFCASKTCCNLLLWAHYAQKHQGAVIGLKPNLEKDSFLRLMCPVEYKNVRPYFSIKFPEPFDDSEEAINKISNSLLYTKSLEWSYEQEVRFVIPDETKDGKPSFLKFYPDELVELYLGCRMSDEDKDKVKQLARKMNPAVRIFHTKLSWQEYQLEFEEE